MKKNQIHDVWKKIDRTKKGQCWPWKGGKFSSGYGRFHLNGKSMLSHRVVFFLEKGKIPDGLMVMHKCNNKICCNPDHLTIGNNRENQLHAVYSGAWKVGKSGIRGVHYIESRGYWTARCYEHGIARNLYTGPSKDIAIKARIEWENKNCIKFKIGEK